MRAGLSAVVMTGLVSVCMGNVANAAQAASTDSPAKKPAAKSSTQKSSTHKTGTKSSTTKAHKTSTSSAASSKSHSSASSRSRSRKKTAKVRGQQKIDSERAQAIQEALIREHYMSGEASGTWNQASEDAMRKYQADHGWQSKQVPDSRALISLGLGPSKDHLLNPDSAMTTGPDAPRAASLSPASHTATPASEPSSPHSGQGDPAGPQ